MINGCLSDRQHRGDSAFGGDLAHADYASDAMEGRIPVGHWAVNPGLVGGDAGFDSSGDNVALFRVLMA